MTSKTPHDAARRNLLRLGAGLAGGAAVSPWLIPGASAEPALGNYPAGVAGDSVFVGIALPRTGTYAAVGEDELKGFELAIEHLNEGHALMHKISPHIRKGVLGKSVKHGVADNQAKPNTAVEVQTRFITENKAMAIAGSVSSAVAVAINKLAQSRKVIYLPGVTGSNDTTGKDCVRYSFRECFYAETAAKAIAPVLVKQLGRNKKIAFLTPDYTYGHTVRQSMQDVLGRLGGWTVATNQVSPLGTTDFSSYLLNVANSGADVVININFGRDAVLSIKQAKQFGILGKMTLVVPYNTPFLAKEVGPEIMQGVFAATDYWWTLQDRFELARDFNQAFHARHGYMPEWSANAAYMQIAMWADAVERARSFYPPSVIQAYEQGVTLQSTVGPVHMRGADHQLVRPVIVVRGKAPSAMKGAEDFYDVVEVVDGAPLMQPPTAFGCRLGSAT